MSKIERNTHIFMYYCNGICISNLLERNLVLLQEIEHISDLYHKTFSQKSILLGSNSEYRKNIYMMFPSRNISSK